MENARKTGIFDLSFREANAWDRHDKISRQEVVCMAFGMMFTVVFALTVVVMIVIITVILLTAVRGIGTWNKNNQSPRITVSAVVVSRRTEVSRRSHANAGGAGGEHHMTSSTWYYVTFQFASGDRMEFPVDGSEYGMLVEGDEGELTFQGTRYLGFERKRP